MYGTPVELPRLGDRPKGPVVRTSLLTAGWVVAHWHRPPIPVAHNLPYHPIPPITSTGTTGGTAGLISIPNVDNGSYVPH